MEENKNLPHNVPYQVYETALARGDRRFHQMWILVIILLGLIIGETAGVFYYESQYQDEVTTIEATQDGSGVNVVNGGDLYGSEGEDNNK